MMWQAATLCAWLTGDTYPHACIVESHSHKAAVLPGTQRKALRFLFVRWHTASTLARGTDRPP